MSERPKHTQVNITQENVWHKEQNDCGKTIDNNNNTDRERKIQNRIHGTSFCYPKKEVIEPTVLEHEITIE